MKYIELLATILLALFFASHCQYDRERANEKETEECRRLALLEILGSRSENQLTAEESAVLNNPQLQHSYTCSAVEGNSPSCREFYTQDPEQAFLTELCEPNFKKSSARCSRQNAIGECRIIDSENPRYEIRIYAQPNDSLDSSKNNCLVSGGKWIEPNIDRGLLPSLLLACGLRESQ